LFDGAAPPQAALVSATASTFKKQWKTQFNGASSGAIGLLLLQEYVAPGRYNLYFFSIGPLSALQMAGAYGALPSLAANPLLATSAGAYGALCFPALSIQASNLPSNGKDPHGTMAGACGILSTAKRRA
jgi:hypothetical protein